MNRDKILFYGVNGVMLLINIFIYFSYLNGNEMIKALIRGIGFPWYLIFFSGLLFIIINVVKILIEKYNIEDKFVFSEELVNLVLYIGAIGIMILSVINLVNSFDFILLKLVFVLGIVNAIFNVYMIITKKETF